MINTAMTITVELSRKELFEIKNRLPANSKTLQKILEAISTYESSEADDEDFLYEEDDSFGKFNLHGDD